MGVASSGLGSLLGWRGRPKTPKKPRMLPTAAAAAAAASAVQQYGAVTVAPSATATVKAAARPRLRLLGKGAVEAVLAEAAAYEATAFEVWVVVWSRGR